MEKIMTKTVSAFVMGTAFLFAASALATEWTIDPTHSNVGFTARHMVSKVSGEFKEYSGEFNFDEKKPSEGKANFSINAKSINTNNEKRDEHLRSEDFFHTEKCPTITFESKKVTAASKNMGKITGDLTMRCVTKPVTLDVEYGGSVKDPWGNLRSGFTLTGKVNRKDFSINWNKALDHGGVMLGDEIALNINIEATEKKAEKK
jgi:polyisoprenoid-binding protein YceI